MKRNIEEICTNGKESSLYTSAKIDFFNLYNLFTSDTAPVKKLCKRALFLLNSIVECTISQQLYLLKYNIAHDIR